ncbi:Putative collagen-binding domain of a collagenase [Arenibacter palladensis]|uniref:Putative collagen-binding domain of a collagenase n=1 Tax=Arenibacter palladensis TaxID=237373 RepID=A0A1M5EY58_9FLAO|nr:DUF5060 domain-containing protein [Arenibacter palladensis]SHF84076.1 Putative collagen-binding domain of a collagenase [Arenibacter palladensis]
MKSIKSILLLSSLLVFFVQGTVMAQKVSGELKKWHKLSLEFEGPNTSESAEENPFLNYRLNVVFKHATTGKAYLIPGYYAADGDAGNTGSTTGNIWKVHFAPDETGEWSYEVDFKKGKWAAVRTSGKLESAAFMDGASGKFTIAQSDKSGRDFRSKGRLDYVGERYLKFAGTGEYFLKCGSDAPENLLAYDQFDGTFKNDGHKDELVKTWEAHRQDWKEGDPTWNNGKGKELIGAINYLASKGMNAFSFLTMNIAGDDQNVFPYVDYDTYDRFDTSKLDQWEVLFEHADKLGMFLHFKTLEHENQGLLDNGGTGLYTKLYYRELVARFGHHLALNWNLAEETGDWTVTPPTFPIDVAERLRLAEYISSIDQYKHHIVIHNGDWFDGLYGTNSKFTGASLQTNKEDFRNVHKSVLRILNDSKEAGKIWAVACDEPGDAQHALITDAEDPQHNDARKNGLWGAMMAGAWGTEWYFGYKHPHSDLSCQDFRSRDLFWDQGRWCLEFFNNNQIPVWEMESMDALISSEGDYVLAKPGSIYVVYLKNGGESSLDLGNDKVAYELQWYNPRKGGALQKGKVKTISGSGKKSLGMPPKEKDQDWVVLVSKS